MSPPAFGYMRIERHGSIEKSNRLHQGMAEHLVRQGFALSKVRVESDVPVGSESARLIDVVPLGRIAAIVVPSPDHFAHIDDESH